jgi:hypothetical protein
MVEPVWLGTVAVNVTSLPPKTFVFEIVNGFVPVKQASFNVEEFEPVMHAIAHAWKSVQLLVSNWFPFLHR